MSRTAAVAIAILGTLSCCGSALAQLNRLVTEVQFADQVLGVWKVVDVQANGRPYSTPHYRSMEFTKNTLTIRTRNDDHVYELTEAKGGEQTEWTLVGKAEKKSFVALVKLEDGKLVIARGLDPTPDIPRPDSITPGNNKIVYTLARASQDEMDSSADAAGPSELPHTASGDRVRWEYRAEQLHGTFGVGSPTITELGNQGWELVSVVTVPNERSIVLYFKRPRR